MNRQETTEVASVQEKIPFTDPETGENLTWDGDRLLNNKGDIVASLVEAIPRFVEPTDNYAEAFGFQWNHWTTLSDYLNDTDRKYREVMERTRFGDYETEGKTVLECGMGGGDDTEVLLKLGFSEVHSFDLSHGVERAAANLHDPRLTISQASIFEIPYADESFDFVFCHRVLQHTPDPERALKCICRKVKTGGVLFAHCYRKSWKNSICFKYKFRWLTKRLPQRYIFNYVTRCGPFLHHINRFLYKFGMIGKGVSYCFIPFYHYPNLGLDPNQLRDFESLLTFDALTPAYDLPMTSQKFRRIIEAEGFEIEHFYEHPISPVYCTAVKR